jgi:hypothetical protein
MKEAQDNEAEIPANVDIDLLKLVLKDIERFDTLDANTVDTEVVFDLVGFEMLSKVNKKMYTAQDMGFAILRQFYEKIIVQNIDLENVCTLLSATDLWIDSPLRQHCISFLIRNTKVREVYLQCCDGKVCETEGYKNVSKEVWKRIFKNL